MSHATDRERLLENLNEPQREAVMHRDGPLLVLAGPGSGKTRVITRRAAYLVHSGVRPHNILAITFTNKAADEMKRRIETLGVDRGMWVYTFHALGVRLLREFGVLAHVQPGFTIYDVADQLRVVKDAMELCKVSETQVKPDAVQEVISSAKNRLLTPPEFYARCEHHDEQILGRIYEAYERLLEQRNAVDFDDLLMRPAIVLNNHPDITERLNVRFQYVLIDEYQDTNHAQYLIANRLSQHHRNLCATGDPDQSIYAWRGADLNNILEFERDNPDAKVVRLEQNYRSTPQILSVADRLIQANKRRKHKTLWTDNTAGTPVEVWQFDRGDDEAGRIADRIRELALEGRSYSDFAMFYRINAVSRGLEDALRRRGIPYRIARGVEFYNRKEIKEIVSYLRLLVNPADDVATLRAINTPARGIGDKTIDRLTAFAGERRVSMLRAIEDVDQIAGLKSAAGRLREFLRLVDDLRALEGRPVSEMVSGVLAMSGLEAMYKQELESGGEDRLANLQEFVTAAVNYQQEAEDPSLVDFLQRVALVSDQDAVDADAGAVMLMTLHAAKGLEFLVVFLVGLEQGMLPHERAIRYDGDIEEERRLCFVGVTRAREELYISFARERLIRGQPVPRARSQFLMELDTGELEWREYRSANPWGRAGGSGSGGGFGSHWGGAGRAGFTDDVIPVDDEGREIRRGRGEAADVSAGNDAVDEMEFPPRGSARAKSGFRRGGDEEIILDANAVRALTPKSSKFAGWLPGTLVKHGSYGVGQVIWIQPSEGQTRAAIKFAGYGEKTFILELAPVEKLER